MKRKHISDEEMSIFCKKIKTDHEVICKKRKIIDDNDTGSSCKKIKLNNYNNSTNSINFDNYKQQRRDILLYI